MKYRRKSIKGQAIVEYIIIIVIVAIATLTVACLFSDRIRVLFRGTILSLSNREDDKTAVLIESEQNTQQIIKDITKHGIKNTDGEFNDGFQ